MPMRELKSINTVLSPACLSMFYDGPYTRDMCDKNFNKLHPSPSPYVFLNILWLINNSINFSERRRQGRAWYERRSSMAERLHRKRSCRVHSRRWHPTKPSGFRQKLCKFRFFFVVRLKCFFISSYRIPLPKVEHKKRRRQFRRLEVGTIRECHCLT